MSFLKCVQRVGAQVEEKGGGISLGEKGGKKGENSRLSVGCDLCVVCLLHTKAPAGVVASNLPQLRL